MKFLALLTAATLFGGMMLYSFGFAPLVFKSLEADQAGRMLRLAFPWYYLFVVLCAALGAALVLTVDRSAAVALAAVAGIALYARQALMPQINAARDQQALGDGTARARFVRLHGFSVLLNFVQLFAVGYVLFQFA